MKNSTTFLCLFLSLFSVPSDAAATGDPGPVQSVVLTVTNSVTKGGTAQANVAANFSTVTNVDVSADPSIVYTSSATSILKVSSNGLVKAVSVGTAAITATYGGKSDLKLVTVLPLPGLAPVLKHRYSFNEATSKTVASDSVGSSDGNLMGGARFSGDGKVMLDGITGYVDLPNGIVSSLTNATFEVWTTWSGTDRGPIFDFGSNESGKGKQGKATSYLDLMPDSDIGTALFQSTGAEAGPLYASTPFPAHHQTHVVVVCVKDAMMKLYIGDTLVGSVSTDPGLQEIADNNNWLGLSNWPGPPYEGSIEEFRIYEGVLSDQQIAFSNAAGPDKLAIDPGAFQSLRLEIPSGLALGGYSNVIVRANYEGVANVNVNFSGATFSSSDPDVVTVSANGALEGVGIGTATIGGGYLGQHAAAQVTVSTPENAITNHTLLHRYSFNDAPGSSVVKDSVGSAHGTLKGGGTFDGRQLTLNGSTGYVDLPKGLLASRSEVTFEGWITENSSVDWQHVFDFGSSTDGSGNKRNGQSYLFFTPRMNGSSTPTFLGPVPGARFAFNGGAGENALLMTKVFATNKETYFAVSYSSLLGVARLYVNGERAAIVPAPSPLSSINMENLWLGRPRFLADFYFNGSYNEFRIWNGALLDAEIAASYAAGPDALPQLNSGSGAPSISVTSAGTQIKLSWPAAEGYVLQSTPSLGAVANWQAVSVTAVDQNGTSNLNISPSGSAMFFRLQKE